MTYITGQRNHLLLTARKRFNRACDDTVCLSTDAAGGHANLAVKSAAHLVIAKIGKR